LDFDGYLDDQHIEAHFIARMRDEWCFSSIEELKLQIQKYIEQARQILQ